MAASPTPRGTPSLTATATPCPGGAGGGRWGSEACTPTPTGTVTATATRTATATATGCALYPIGLSNQSLAGVPPGGNISNIPNGTQPGQFGWLTWTGDQSDPTLVTSLTPPGNSATYVNPYDPSDHVVAVGDWVRGRSGVNNSSGVGTELNVLETMEIVVPVWDVSSVTGSSSLYHVAGFASVQITGYALSTPNWISATYLGTASCGGPSSQIRSGAADEAIAPPGGAATPTSSGGSTWIYLPETSLTMPPAGPGESDSPSPAASSSDESNAASATSGLGGDGTSIPFWGS